jgi:hypothetical protein
VETWRRFTPRGRSIVLGCWLVVRMSQRRIHPVRSPEGADSTVQRSSLPEVHAAMHDTKGRHGTAPRECAALTTCWPAAARRVRSTVSPWPARHETKRQAAATAARRSAGCSEGGELAERPRAGEWGRCCCRCRETRRRACCGLNGRRERASMPTAERQAHAASWSSARGGEDEALRGSRARSAAEWAQGQHFSRHKSRREGARGAQSALA